MVRPARWVCAAPLLWAVWACAGCGPITYHSEVSRRAERAVKAAQAAQADIYAPYWFTRALEYLREARAVAAHADFQGAQRFGKLAAESAIQAKADAEVAAHDPAKRSRDPAPPPRAAVPARDEHPAPADPARTPGPRGLAPAKGPP